MTPVVDPPVRVAVDGGSVHVVSTIQGLAGEAERVRAAFEDVNPRVVALGLGPEGVAGLMHYLKEKERASVEPPPPPPEKPAEPRRHKDGTYYWEDVEDPYDYDAAEMLTESEAAYGIALRAFGDVKLPPRDLLVAVELAGKAGVPVLGVDLSEEEYGEEFSKRVSTWGLLRYTRRVNKLSRRPPKAENARDFVLAWDAALRRVKAVDGLERAREHTMADRARALAKEHGDVLLVVEVPREAGVVAALRESPVA